MSTAMVGFAAEDVLEGGLVDHEEVDVGGRLDGGGAPLPREQGHLAEELPFHEARDLAVGAAHALGDHHLPLVDDEEAVARAAFFDHALPGRVVQRAAARHHAPQLLVGEGPEEVHRAQRARSSRSAGVSRLSTAGAARWRKTSRTGNGISIPWRRK